MKTVQEAQQLLHKYVQSQSLRQHCYAVAQAMKYYAQKNNLSDQEVQQWEIAGLLHDFDYEQYPTLQEHPFKGIEILNELNYPQTIIDAILGHANHTHHKRTTQMAKTLFAVDELCGLIMALAKVKPDGLQSMTAQSVRKALKKKGFAQNIDRHDIAQGIQELQVSEDEHYQTVIDALKMLDLKGA